MYGITETTVHVTYRPLSVDDATGCGGSRIGQVIPDLQLYVVGERMRLVPAGVEGELYIAGAGLARGYMKRPALTAARFLPNPFAANPGERLYRTGDLARWRGASDLEYLGRIDQQVKVRGFRIELGEIETTLAEHPALHDSIVIADRRDADDCRLVAYVVPKVKPAPSNGDLRAFLAKKLPDYMIPAAFIAIDAIPLNANGKLDRAALPSPARVRPELHDDYVRPRSSLEEVLASHWASVLGLDRAGVYDNFFELGGHSLLMTRLAAQLQDIFPTRTPMLTLLFQNPTVASLAEAVTANNAAPQDTETVAQLWQRVNSLSDEEV
ncbi:MAG TPA: non-ribosomal peptide synthetase, partial [Burkholderiaceae bacterium]|nr:non-ribosomal peptide synthetase [Burkholderiaceae bacterium]